MYGACFTAFLNIRWNRGDVNESATIVPNNDFIAARTFNSMVATHGTTMIFLFVMPLTAAFFNFLIPLQIGARDVAFPRMNALSFWIFLFGGILLNAGFLVDQVPRGGWFGYQNLSSKLYTPDMSADFWAMGLQVVGLASLIASINFITTILNMRCKGMTLLKMPIFTWTSFVTNITSAFITLSLLWHCNGHLTGSSVQFFNPGAGGQLSYGNTFSGFLVTLKYIF